MDSVFVEAGYSGLESAEKNVFDNFLEILKHPFFSEQFKKKVFVVGVLVRQQAVDCSRAILLKKSPLQVFLILKYLYKNICDGVQ